jgi:hypothetical protein
MRYRVMCCSNNWDEFEEVSDNLAALELIKRCNSGAYGPAESLRHMWEMINLFRIDQEEITTPISKEYDDGSDNQ